LTAIILSYVLTSFVNGLVSARLYRQLGGKNWTWNIITAGEKPSSYGTENDRFAFDLIIPLCGPNLLCF